MRRAGYCVAAGVMAACSNIASPARSSVYQYALITSTSSGAPDTMVFHWPRSFLPVRVWVADTAGIAPYVPIGLERWEHAFLYGEYRAVQVSDSNQADVIFIEGIPPLEGIQARASQCTGATDPPDPDTNTWPLPIHIYIYPEIGDLTDPALATCYRITVTHELGHSLGILVHSTFNTDVMFANPVADSISTDDRETAETLYHLPANVVPAGRR